MNGVKEYKIVINGIEESIKAVDSLNTQLDALAKKIKDLQGSKVNVATGGGSSSKSSADDKLYDKIEQTQERITQANSEDYQILLQKKAELKEIEKTQKAIFAGIQAEGKEYANTLNGQRQRLADMKAALGNIELGSADFDKQVKAIDELNSKILEIEKSYGQYGRQVGNYAGGVAEGLTKLKIDVGGITQEFDNAKQAVMQLKKEMQTLSTKKDLGIITDEESERLKSLIPVVSQLASSVKDAGKPMDALMDTMKGFTALGSVGQGFTALFGFDGSAIQESIQKLVALQNILQGLETIQQQMLDKDGLGAIFSDASGKIDQFVAKITGAKVGLNGLEASSKTATVAVKGLSTVMKAASGLALAWALDKAVDQLKDLSSEVKSLWGDITGGEKFTQQEQLANAIENVNRKLENRLQLINEDKSLSEWGKQTEAINEVNKALKEQIGLYTELNKEGGSFWEKMQQYAGQGIDDVLSGKGLLKTFGSMTQEIANSISSFAAARKSNEELEQSVASLGNSVKVASKQIEADANEMVQRWVKSIDQCDLATEEGRKQFQELAKALDDDSVLNSVLLNLDRYFRSPETRAEIESIIAKVKQLRGALSAPLGSFASNVSKYIQSGIGKMQKFIDDANKKQQKDTQSAIKSGGAKVGETVKNVEVDIANARVQAMRDGFVKTMAQLQLERNRRIEEARKSGKMVEEQIALINQEYENKTLNARERYYKERLSQAESFAEEMKNLEKETTEIIYRINDLSRDIQKGHIESNALEVVAGYSSTYDAVSRLIYNSERGMEAVKNLGDEVLAEWERLDAQVVLTSNNLLRFEEDNGGKNQIINGMNYDQALTEWDNAIKEYEKFVNKYTELQSHTITELESKDELGYSWRYEAREKFYNSILNLEKEQNKNELVATRKRIEEETKLLTEEEKKRHEAVYGRLTPDNMGAGGLDSSSEEEISAWLDSLEAAYKNGEILFEDYVKTTGATAIQGYAEARQELRNYLQMTEDERAKSQVSEKELQDNLQHQYEEYIKNIEKEATLHQGRLRAIQREGELKQQKATQDTNEKTRQITANYYGNIEKEFENTLSSISRKISNIPQKNALGFINYGATKKELKELEKSVDNTLADIKRKREELIEDRTAKRISFEDFDVAMANLDALESQATETGKEIGDKLSSLVTEQIKAINDILQAVGQSFGQIFQSFSEMQQNQYEAMIDEQQKYIDEYEKLLDKQRDITQDYADKVNDIEDELSTARGDRRQQLIDHLNAEMAAQRASMAQEKKLEKEKEKAEKKRKKLEYEAAVARKKADLVQAAINAAMAVSMAAVNKWPIPAVPMMALAAAVGAAQIAAVKSQRIPQYATGGVLVGKSHREGGIKVLGGAAEVEGGEYITNKKSTAANVDLLSFINEKKRKVNLDELIEFYSSNKKVVKNNLKTKFEDGGVVPIIDDAISDNRLLSAFEAYSNRPVYVSVVDINDKQADVRNVQVLAGL